MNGGNITTPIILFAAAFFASLVGVGLFFRWSLSRKFFDVPNERSSHSTPTPRGGGLIIVLVCLAGYVVLGSVLGLPISWGYFTGALIVAAISWLDDLYSVPFWARLLVHLAAAAILILDAGYWSDLFLPLLSVHIPLGNVFGALVTVAWLVWLLNAYNFMDGIDGIAGLQAVLACVAWSVTAYFLNLESTLLYSGIVASSSAAFLIHNWQLAKVFMGDVGSAFLGFTLGAMPLLARKESGTDAPVLPVVGLLFVWFFVFDTGFTFVRRLASKQRVWEAHREHIYQKLIIEGAKHSTVTLLYGLLSAILSCFVLLAINLSGIYPALAFLSLLVLTFLVTYFGIRKKR